MCKLVTRVVTNLQSFILIEKKQGILEKEITFVHQIKYDSDHIWGPQCLGTFLILKNGVLLLTLVSRG